MDGPGQQFVIGSLVAVGEAVFAVARNCPVCIRVDATTGAIVGAKNWPVLETHRRQPVATGMAAHQGSVWISSPCAGGVVRFDAELRACEVIGLDSMPGPIAALGEDLVVFAHREWESEAPPHDDGSPVGHERIAHPVIWRDAPEEPQQPAYRWIAYTPDDPSPVSASADDDDDPSIVSIHLASLDGEDVDFDEDFDDDLDDEDELEAIRPIWRITNGAATRIDLGGDAGDGVTLENGDLVAAVRRRTDPLIKVRRGRRSYVSCQYPEAVVAYSPHGSSRVIHEFDDAVEVCLFDAQVWVRFNDESERECVALLDVATGELQPVDHDRDVVAIVDGVALSFDLGQWDESRDHDDLVVLHRFDTGTGLDLSAVLMPPVARGDDAPLATGGGHVWFATASRSALVKLSVRSGDVSVIPVAVDVAALVPLPSPPHGLDVPAFEARTLADLRDQLLSGWVDAAGASEPFIEGITFTSFELRGSFPDSMIEVLFQAERRPGCAFGVRIPLFDALGNDIDLSLTGIHLMEIIEAGPGLHLVESGELDASGIVWLAFD